ncbi:MAG TPA: RNA polymerase sigma factor [Nocardioidaceae bacterium]|nr:RNA polymerase sigma factor [Nocardioidaceae bacterium]
MPQPGTREAVDAVWRIESARLIAGLARITGDVGVAEDLAQDALVAALEQWPAAGVPRNPGAWLMAVGKRRAVDLARRGATLRRKVDELGHDLAQQTHEEPDLSAALDEEIEDNLLRLIFICCHPVLPNEGRVALTLRLLGGLTTREIARGFLVAEATMGQRISRAKRTLTRAGVPFEMPDAAERQARLTSVLEVIYLVFNEGYSATAGDDWMRPSLCDEALRLGRMLAELAPGDPEVHGLVALMEIQASRTGARLDRDGRPVLLLDQDRSRWDRLLVSRGLSALDRALELGGRSPFVLQAEIAACHARATSAEDTDWERIAGLYDLLAAVMPSPVVELNRGVAHAMAFGPGAGLAIVAPLSADPSLRSYHLLPSVLGDLLARLGRWEEARREFDRAASLTQNAAERALLTERARGCAPDPGVPA